MPEPTEETTVGNPDQSVDQRAPETIEDDIEATRQRLASTIDQLAYRASPKTIARREVASIRAHFVDANGHPRTDNILKAAGAVVGAVAVIVILRKVVR